MFLFHKKSMIYSPCNGTFKPLSEVKDEVFSKELMGKGFAVIPDTGDIHSPVDGKVTMVFFQPNMRLGLQIKTILNIFCILVSILYS